MSDLSVNLEQIRHTLKNDTQTTSIETTPLQQPHLEKIRRVLVCVLTDAMFNPTEDHRPIRGGEEVGDPSSLPCDLLRYQLTRCGCWRRSWIPFVRLGCRFQSCLRNHGDGGRSTGESYGVFGREIEEHEREEEKSICDLVVQGYRIEECRRARGDVGPVLSRAVGNRAQEQ